MDADRVRDEIDYLADCVRRDSGRLRFWVLVGMTAHLVVFGTQIPEAVVLAGIVATLAPTLQTEC